MNKVILMGRLTRDPEVRYGGANNTAVAKFSFSVPRKFKRDGEPDCDFINCTAFGKTAEFIEKYCTKGTKLLLEGRWQTGSYTNREGQKVYTNDCMVEICEFAESKNASQQNTQDRPMPTPNSDDGFMQIPDGIEDELPFN
uniref:Single-stranded DNA-binding protein n=1 Tax=Dulem virus 39 TaxID=3145757 RepID=A0AAU8B6V1_9CAUD